MGFLAYTLLILLIYYAISWIEDDSSEESLDP